MVSKQITMAHGSGGKDSAELMAQVFGKHFDGEILARLEDAATFDLSGRIATSTDSFVVTPLEFKGGDIGKLAVCGTVNDLLMMGATPKYLTCGFILEEGLDIDLLDRITLSMALEAKRADVEIVAGDTKVVEGSGGLFINTTGIGLVPQAINLAASSLREGDRIIVNGNLGDHHATILSARMNIENTIESDCAVLSDVATAALDYEVRAMRDVTRGGLGTVLNELSNSSGVNIELMEDSIPVSPQTRSFCDLLGLDPIYMGNEGKMVVVVSEGDAEKALEAIRATEHGHDAQIIGTVKEGSGVTIVTHLGGSRKIDVLYGEGLPRIC